MIRLNGVTLSQDLFWSNELTSPTISDQEERTILGVSVRNTMPIVGGRVVVLEAERSGSSIQGYFTYAQVLQFREYERTAAQILFEYEGQSFVVVVRSGGVNVTPHIKRPNPSETDMYSGTLILKEV